MLIHESMWPITIEIKSDAQEPYNLEVNKNKLGVKKGDVKDEDSALVNGKTSEERDNNILTCNGSQ